MWKESELKDANEVRMRVALIVSIMFEYIRAAVGVLPSFLPRLDITAPSLNVSFSVLAPTFAQSFLSKFVSHALDNSNHFHVRKDGRHNGGTEGFRQVSS